MKNSRIKGKNEKILLREKKTPQKQRKMIENTNNKKWKEERK